MNETRTEKNYSPSSVSSTREAWILSCTIFQWLLGGKKEAKIDEIDHKNPMFVTADKENKLNLE